MSKRSYFSLYQSPNIVIVPTISFSADTENKKMKLDTDNYGGSTNKIANTSDIKTSKEEFTDTEMIKSINKTASNGNYSLPSKTLTYVNAKHLRLNRLKPISPCMRNLSNLIDINNKSNTSLACKKINKETDPGAKIDIKHISRSKSTVGKDFNWKANQYPANDDKMKQHCNASKKSCSGKKVLINKEMKDNTNSLKNNDNINIKSLSEIKTLKKYDACKNKVSLKNLHCDLKTDSKHTHRAKRKPNKGIKLDNTNVSTNLKTVDKSKQAKQKIIGDKSCCKLNKGSENNNEVTFGCNTKTKELSTKIDTIKRETKIYKRTKEKLILSADGKKIAENKKNGKEMNRDHSSKNKHKIDDKCKHKKVESKNKSKQSHPKPKLKLSENIINTGKLTQKSTRTVRSIDENDTPKKVKTDNTVTTSTQNDPHTETESHNSNNINRKKEIKLIFNLVISHSGKKKIKTVDNNISPVSSSEISFLDDIDIDEIVDSLKQFKHKTDAAHQELEETVAPALKIDHISSNNINEENGRKNNLFNNKSMGESKLLRINAEDNLLNKENAMHCDRGNAFHISEKDKLLQYRTPMSVVQNSTLPKQNKKCGNQDKEAPMHVVKNEDIVEVLSDCCTIITEALNHPDIEDISANKTKVETIKSMESTQTTVFQQSKQNNDIFLQEQRKERHSSSDPIEAQLFKMFGMNKKYLDASSCDVDKCTVIETVKTESVDDIPKTEQQTTTLLIQSRNIDPHQNCTEPQINTDRARQCVLSNESKSTIITPKVIKHKKTTMTQKYTGADEKLNNPTKYVKSEVIKVTQTHKAAVSLEDNDFVKALEDRMFDFLNVRYTVTSLMHVGIFSKIFQCKDSAGSVYAIKILRSVRDRYHLGIKKENMLMSVRKDIPKEKLYCVYLINGFSMCGHWCFLMEYYPRNLRQALQEYNKSFLIDRVQVLAKQLIMAVIVLRNNNIVHSDIRPSHILINSTNNRLKLCGFDSSHYIDDAVIEPFIGHQNYRAPEVILGHCSGFSLDVWSTALVMYEMATNIVLFPSFNNNDALYKQMCTLGGIPTSMLMTSMYKEDHFYGRNFMKRIGSKKTFQTIKYIKQFNRSKRIPRTIFGAYKEDWMESRTEEQQGEDLAKLGSFLSLLGQMLVMYPRYRLPIEFVYANAFIYE